MRKVIWLGLTLVVIYFIVPGIQFFKEMKTKLHHAWNTPRSQISYMPNDYETLFKDEVTKSLNSISGEAIGSRNFIVKRSLDSIDIIVYKIIDSCVFSLDKVLQRLKPSLSTSREPYAPVFIDNMYMYFQFSQPPYIDTIFVNFDDSVDTVFIQKDLLLLYTSANMFIGYPDQEKADIYTKNERKNRGILFIKQNNAIYIVIGKMKEYSKSIDKYTLLKIIDTSGYRQKII